MYINLDAKQSIMSAIHNMMRVGINRSYRQRILEVVFIHYFLIVPPNSVSSTAPEVNTQLFYKPFRSILQLLLSRPRNADDGPLPSLTE